MNINKVVAKEGLVLLFFNAIGLLIILYGYNRQYMYEINGVYDVYLAKEVLNWTDLVHRFGVKFLLFGYPIFLLMRLIIFAMGKLFSSISLSSLDVKAINSIKQTLARESVILLGIFAAGVIPTSVQMLFGFGKSWTGITTLLAVWIFLPLYLLFLLGRFIAWAIHTLRQKKRAVR